MTRGDSRWALIENALHYYGDEIPNDLEFMRDAIHALHELRAKQGSLTLCIRRQHQLEKGIQNFLAAYDESEMSNTQEAIEHLRLLMAQT